MEGAQTQIFEALDQPVLLCTSDEIDAGFPPSQYSGVKWLDFQFICF